MTEQSLFERLGGMSAVNAAVDIFYIKVLGDKRVAKFFTSVDMIKMHQKQKAFLAYAFGAPHHYTGQDMRNAHSHLKLKEEHFNAVAEHLKATLEELNVRKELINEVLTIALATKEDVLNK